MIDYLTHIAALIRSQSGLSTLSTDPSLTKERDKLLSQVSADHDCAVLGALFDHVIFNAVSDGSELALLEQAAGLWSQGLNLYAQFSTVRASIETAFANPSLPEAVVMFNTATCLEVEARKLDRVRSQPTDVSLAYFFNTHA